MIEYDEFFVWYNEDFINVELFKNFFFLGIVFGLFMWDFYVKVFLLL